MKELLFNLIPTFLLLVGMWFLFNFLAGKSPFFKENRNSKIIFVTLSSLIFYVLSLAVIFSFLLKPQVENFNKNEWLSKEEIRFRMTDDLIKNEILIGSNKMKVKETLGEPNVEDKEKWYYKILGRSAFDLFYFDLIVTFEKGEVVRVEKFVQN